MESVNGSPVYALAFRGNLRLPIVLPENLAPCDLHAQWLTLLANGELAATSALRVEIR